MVDLSTLHKNKNRVLLTEVMPFEVVLGVETEQFFKNMDDPVYYKLIKESGYVVSDGKDNFKIPFDYHIRRSGGEKSRKLSLMHPNSQLECVEFYEDNKDFILYYTSLSPFSLRHPYAITKSYSYSLPPASEAHSYGVNEDHVSDGGIAIENENIYGNYFEYREYDLSYKFFDSFEFFNLEKRFTMMRHLDVASCFYHIYTHSVCWAVKDKKTAKLIHNAKDVFENRFDKLMSDMNYGETNGIIVGPEISRIFAEIIFQRMDLQVLEKIKERFGPLSYGKDFEIRRYVDDYYVFTNSSQVLDQIQEVLSDVIEEFKLYLNKSKIADTLRPMVNTSQRAKAELQRILNSKFSEWGKNKYQIDDLTKETFDLINDIRLSISKTQASYGDINACALSSIRVFLSSEVLKFFKEYPAAFNSNILLLLTELAFFLFSMDWHPTVSFKICRIISTLKEICGDNTAFQAVIKHKVISESKKILDIMEMQSLKGCTNIEMMNLLITLKAEYSHSFSEKKLFRYFHLDENSEDNQLDYFQICVLLFLCGNDTSFSNLRKTVETVIERKFDQTSGAEIRNNAELTYLLLDLMTCPYLGKEFKNNILRHAGWSENKIGVKRMELAKPGQWYFKWDFQDEFLQNLKKKEYRPVYE